jgi:hypothetical protein
MHSVNDLFVQVARLALVGRSQDVQAYLRKSMKGIRQIDSEMASELTKLLSAAPNLEAPFRDVGGSFAPVDTDSRLALVRHDHSPSLEAPVLARAVEAKLEQIVLERRNLPTLAREGLTPTRSMLLVGPPGVGKTLSARWLAGQLDRPLLTLDLATVMSSYLGKTGSNIRAVLDYAKSVPCVLLLDEFDAIAKRRDDASDIGELRRLVTVILQEVDDWPADNLLIAATNHGELLDPAIWRRFDEVLHFDVPDERLAQESVARMISTATEEASVWAPILAKVWKGRSFSDLSRGLQACRRKSVITGLPLSQCIAEHVRDDLVRAPVAVRRDAALELDTLGLPERQIYHLTGVARDTLRKYRSRNQA